MCQLTKPPPSFEQVWNWKLNIDGGLRLFPKKRATAIAYLHHKDRSYGCYAESLLGLPHPAAALP